MHFLVGEDSGVQLWKDIWLGDQSFQFKFSFLYCVTCKYFYFLLLINAMRLWWESGVKCLEGPALRWSRSSMSLYHPSLTMFIFEGISR